MKVLEIIGSAVSDTVEYVVEKNKIQAQQNRLRMVMRNEADLIILAQSDIRTVD